MGLKELYYESKDSGNFCQKYFEYFSSFLNDDAISASLNHILGTLKRVAQQGGRIYFCGNGGSASTANHFAADLGNNTREVGHASFLTESLCCNEALVTAIGNDFGYEHVFTRQLEERLNSKDAVVAISASGNSPNIINAIEYAKTVGAVTIGFSGFCGGKLKEIAEINFHAAFAKGEYGPVEDFHLMANHYLVTALRLERRGHP